MRIDIIAIFPEMFQGPFTESIIKRAVNKGIVDIELHNLRDYSTDKHKKVDDYPFSAGAGMVMMIEPVDHCITHLKSQRDYDEVIYMSPDGETNASVSISSPVRSPSATMCSQGANSVPPCSSTVWCDCCLAPWATRPQLSPTRSRTDWSPLLSIPAPVFIKDGKCRKSFCRATT